VYYYIEYGGSERSNTMSSKLAKVLSHPEVEIRGDRGTAYLLEQVPTWLNKELSQPCTIENLMRAQHALMIRLTKNAKQADKDWYQSVIAQLAGWAWGERFLKATHRTIKSHLDWSYVPDNNPLRRNEVFGTIADLFKEQPATIIAPLLRGVKNTRH